MVYMRVNFHFGVISPFKSQSLPCWNFDLLYLDNYVFNLFYLDYFVTFSVLDSNLVFILT